MPFTSWAAPQHSLQIWTRNKTGRLRSSRNVSDPGPSSLLWEAVLCALECQGRGSLTLTAPHTCSAAQHSQSWDVPATGSGNSSQVCLLLLSHHPLWSFSGEEAEQGWLMIKELVLLKIYFLFSVNHNFLPLPLPSCEDRSTSRSTFFLFKHQKCNTFQLLLIQVLQWWLSDIVQLL